MHFNKAQGNDSGSCALAAFNFLLRHIVVPMGEKGPIMSRTTGRMRLILPPTPTPSNIHLLDGTYLWDGLQVGASDGVSEPYARPEWKLP